MSNSVESQYQEYAEEWEKAITDPSRSRIANTWFDTTTLDAWRHARMRAPLIPIIESDPEAKWLTVGDGRFGTDGHFLLESGAENVHCTDVSDTLLKIAHERKFIHSYSAENAERMSFSNNSFDYVYCKESFHHFSRPYAALYEMYRVARKGVILTEPRDTSIDKEPLELFKDLIKTLLGKSTRSSHGFEPIGNYIYSISEKEMEKAAMGLSSNTIATIGCNDVYRDGIEFISQISEKDEDIKFSNAIKSELKRMDLLCKFGIKKTTLLTVVLFKNTPNIKLLSKMSAYDWKIKSLPKNPYK